MKITSAPSPTRRGWKARAAAACLAALLLSTASAAAVILDRVVATINDQAITMSELQEAVAAYQSQVEEGSPEARTPPDRKALERRVLEDLIDKKLIEGYAEKMNIQASEEEVDMAIRDVLHRAHITDEELREALKNDGMGYDEYRKQVRDRIIKAKMIQQKIRSEVNIKENQIEAYYLDHPDEFRAEEGVVLRHILFLLPKDPTPEEVEAVRNKALQVRAEIEAGLPFEDAAKRYSQDSTAARGGWLGFFRKGSLSPAMEEAVERLGEGEVSEPIRTALGIHILKVEEKTQGGVRPLEKVRDSIRQKLFEEAAERHFEEWRRELRKNAYIEVFL